MIYLSFHINSIILNINKSIKFKIYINSLSDIPIHPSSQSSPKSLNSHSSSSNLFESISSRIESSISAFL